MTAQPQHSRRRSAAAADPARRGVGAGPAPVKAVTTFESFYQRELKAVIGLAYALSGSRSAAEDLAQDAFLAAHRSWDKISRYDKPEAWVRRVVANMSVSMFRRKIREARAVARINRNEAILPDLPAQDHEFWMAVRSLPKRQAQAVALHYLEDRPIADIAGILECAEGTVKVHLHKGRIRLAEKLGLEVES
ncbi:MAG TPA: SigE family RNA polymerase sigma factor [Acidimicrobiia bacterium]